jgi:glycerol-3-phosphate acyltransferase PlsY
VPILGYILTAVAAYFLGSIPTGYLAGRMRGIDIRTVGSGNIGATNVFRHLGRTAGALVLLVDALKGWVAVALVSVWICRSYGTTPGSAVFEWAKICAGVAAILGHNYTCWLRFKGGKGIATSAGVLLALVPVPLGIILAVWIVVFAATRYVSLASIAASATLPFASWLTGKSWTLVFVTGALAVMAILKHRANIKRLLNGTESRIGKRSGNSAKPTS